MRGFGLLGSHMFVALATCLSVGQLRHIFFVSVPSRNVDDLSVSGDLEEAQPCTEKPCPVDCSFQARMTWLQCSWKTVSAWMEKNCI